ncbi:MAG: GTP 3',8-cyclase MoaA [Nitrososphaeraceae archaeon]
MKAEMRSNYKRDIEELQPNQLGHYKEEKSILTDGYNRVARKLRVSVTDRCNMRCMYCMPPQDKVQWFNDADLLNYDEITGLVSILADLGIEKIRLTGGEPLLRPKLENLIISLAKINNIKSISMTTNGMLLSNKVKLLKDAGLGSVNISLDTFRPDRFKAMTGVDGLNKVLDAVDKAHHFGLKVKINTVVVRGWNNEEIVDFANFARDTGHTVRFIEFMPLDGSGIWQSNLVFSKKEMVKIISERMMEILPLKMSHANNDHNTNSTDPAMLYSFADGKGIIGFIPSITEPFCGNCDRIRLTSNGRLLTCLFENPGHDLASMLRSGKSEYYIKKNITENIKKKPEGIIKIIRTNMLRPSLNLMHTIGG